MAPTLLVFLLLAISLVGTFAARSDWIGEFSPPSSSCQPSATCCCARSTILITEGNSNNTISVSGETDGGQGCSFQRTLGGDFTIKNETVAELSILGQFVWCTASSNFSVITITSTQSTCPNQASRTFASSSSSSTGGGTSPSSSSSSSSTGDSGIFFQQEVIKIDEPDQFSVVFLAFRDMRWCIISFRVSDDTWTNTYMTPDTQLSARLFAYKPVTIPQGKTIEYRFTFMTFSAGAVDTIYFLYTAPIPSSSSSSSSSTGNDPGNQPTDITSNDLSVFTGLWHADGSCVPSTVCCCAIGDMILQPLSSSQVNKFRLSGNLDGGSACMSMTAISADFAIDAIDHSIARFAVEHTTAVFVANVTTITVVESTASSTQPVSEIHARRLVFTNNIYPACPAVLLKTAEWDPSLITPPRSSSSSTGSGGPVDNQSAARKFVGDYQFDDTCEPSNHCCCGVGGMRIQGIPLKQDMVVLSGNLDAGPACLNMEVLEGVFVLRDSYTLVNQTEQGFIFTAAFNADYSTVTLSNTVQKQCLTIGHRSKSDRSSSSVQAACAYGTLLGVCMGWLVGSYARGWI